MKTVIASVALLIAVQAAREDLKDSEVDKLWKEAEKLLEKDVEKTNIIAENPSECANCGGCCNGGGMGFAPPGYGNRRPPPPPIYYNAMPGQQF